MIARIRPSMRLVAWSDSGPPGPGRARPRRGRRAVHLGPRREAPGRDLGGDLARRVERRLRPVRPAEAAGRGRRAGLGRAARGRDGRQVAAVRRRRGQRLRARPGPPTASRSCSSPSGARTSTGPSTGSRPRGARPGRSWRSAPTSPASPSSPTASRSRSSPSSPSPRRSRTQEEGVQPGRLRGGPKPVRVWLATLDDPSPPKAIDSQVRHPSCDASPTGDRLAVALAPTPRSTTASRAEGPRHPRRPGGLVRFETPGKLGKVALSPDGEPGDIAGGRPARPGRWPFDGRPGRSRDASRRPARLPGPRRRRRLGRRRDRRLRRRRRDKDRPRRGRIRRQGTPPRPTGDVDLHLALALADGHRPPSSPSRRTIPARSSSPPGGRPRAPADRQQPLAREHGVRHPGGRRVQGPRRPGTPGHPDPAARRGAGDAGPAGPGRPRRARVARPERLDHELLDARPGPGGEGDGRLPARIIGAAPAGASRSRSSARATPRARSSTTSSTPSTTSSTRASPTGPRSASPAARMAATPRPGARPAIPTDSPPG